MANGKARKTPKATRAPKTRTAGAVPAEITFLVPGQEQALDVGAAGIGHGATRAAGAAAFKGQPTGAAGRGTLKQSVRVGATRGTGGAVRVTARPGEDVVVLEIADGPTLVLHPLDARDLMQAQAASPRQAATRGASPSARSKEDPNPNSNDVVVSAQLGWPGSDVGTNGGVARGVSLGSIGQAVLSAFHVVGNLLKDPAVTLATAAITKKVDGGVIEGVYELSPDRLDKLKDGPERLRTSVAAAPNSGAQLVFIHGAFVDTVSTFGRLWSEHPESVTKLFSHYGTAHALDHATMGSSPIGNALTLVDAMPAGARLHLLTHSRGGLVAEVLVRACNGGPLTAETEALFKAKGYERHRAELKTLVATAQKKGIRVERVVRVACPARGTLLASKRFDAYLSILKWGLELAHVPVAPELVDFLHEVALRRGDPTELPGIEAMMPTSPVVAWVNSPCAPVAGDLRVIAGDMQGDSIMSWVKTLLTDAFYWTDNDIVVQTRSMYGGTPRAGSGPGGATFLLDRGGKVSHFTYFANERTVDAVTSALLDDSPGDFQIIGPLSVAGTDASGSRGMPVRDPATPAAAAALPAVFVLPGILGSHLAIDGERVWLALGFINGLKRLAWHADTASHVSADGPIESVYGALAKRLADTHEVFPFAFDWRRPIEDEAKRLADAIDEQLALRATSKQPVRIVAHSMGGLLARAVQLVRPATWQRLMARDGARLLMLGTPNAGSWSPMQTLSGDDTFGNALVAFGSLFDSVGTRKRMADMPGFIQLQAGLLDTTLGLAKSSAWQKLADDDLAALRERSTWHDEGQQPTIYEWGAPSQATLDTAVALRKKLDAQAASLGTDADRMLLVVGHAALTPCGITFGPDGLEYVESRDGGDGRVMLESALLPNVRTWKFEASHGDLPTLPAAFAGYVELLQTGSTGLLEVLDPAAAAAARAGAPSTSRSPSSAAAATASADSVVYTRRSRGMQPSEPPRCEADMFGDRMPPPESDAMRVVVLNGDLKFVRQPLLLGHYRSMSLTGTEAVVDGLVNHAMSQALAAGLYPEMPGAYQVFGNRREDPSNVFDMARPQAAIVVGLGEEGKLTAADLTYSVRQAVLAYSQRLAEAGESRSGSFELAATLLGSGGTGTTAGSVARHITQGALEANAKLKQVGWPVLGELTLVELYLERATDAWRALQLQHQAAPGRIDVVGRVRSGTGALRRSLESGYRGSAYDFISARTVDMTAEQRCISFTLDTRRARAEVRAQRAQGSLLKELVLKASNDANHDPLIGRTLFNLLIPIEMEVFLGGTTEMLLELDSGTAVIPWELLDTDPDPQSSDRRPWAIRSKLLRKLRVDDFRDRPSDASTDASVLVIGEPRTSYPPLPSARAEAIAVAKRLSQPDVGVAVGKLRLLVNDDDAQTVINALFEHPYRVIHIAGHGAASANGGVVLSGDGTYLGANEVRAMRVVPELVFLNCCHLAAFDVQRPLQIYDRAAFAANLAEELIRVGVRCVIAAGWAVEDTPAEVFATAFYGALLQGARFIEAVATARDAAWAANPNGNTWAAYQCYGDPDWRWERQMNGGQRPATALKDKYAGIASPVTLALALENIATSSRYAGAAAGNAAQSAGHDVVFLESMLDPPWRGMGAIAESFGAAYSAINDSASAIRWYRHAIAAPDGSASFRAGEQLGNELVREAKRIASKANGDATVAATGRAMLDEGITLLGRLAALQPTFERVALLGLAYKRLTMMAWQAGQFAAAAAALERAVESYEQAAAMAREVDATHVFYPLKNGVSCELRSAFLARREPTLTPERISDVASALKRAATTDPDFWSVVGQTELRVLDAARLGRLASVAPMVTARFEELKERVAARDLWDSVYAEACFTLEPYQALHRAGTPERAAAAALLVLLRSFANG